MVIVLGVAVGIVTVALLLGAVTGRISATSCCSVADPRRDARMRAAFESGDVAPPDRPDGETVSADGP